MPKLTKEFDKLAYDRQYRKEKYKQITVVFTKEEAEKVERAAGMCGMSKSAFIKNAVLQDIARG